MQWNEIKYFNGDILGDVPVVSQTVITMWSVIRLITKKGQLAHHPISQRPLLTAKI